MRGPLRVEEIFHLAPGAIRIETATGMVDRKRCQTSDRRVSGLDGRDAEIGTYRGGGLGSQPRPGRKPELPGRDNGVQEEIACDAFLAAEALPHFAVQAETRHRPIFGERSRLQRVIRVAQAVERRGARVFALPNDFHGWAGFDLPEVNNGKPKTVARPKKIWRRSHFADAEQGTAGQRECALGRAGPFGPNTQLAAD